MSITTQSGDSGTTGLLFGRRVAKTDARIVANGAIDELNAALGLARVHCGEMPLLQGQILAIQKELMGMMAEVATLPEDRAQAAASGYRGISEAMVVVLHEAITVLEEERKGVSFSWAVPGENMPSATLELARTAARRAERAVWLLHESDPTLNEQVARYLNRLSDLLWLWARQMEPINKNNQPDAKGNK